VEANAVVSRASVPTGFELAGEGTGLTAARGAAEAGGLGWRGSGERGDSGGALLWRQGVDQNWTSRTTRSTGTGSAGCEGGCALLLSQIALEVTSGRTAWMIIIARSTRG
jgi:hypothetical protein